MGKKLSHIIPQRYSDTCKYKENSLNNKRVWSIKKGEGDGDGGNRENAKSLPRFRGGGCLIILNYNMTN